MNKPLPARLAELERLLIQQAEALRQRDTQLRLVEETEVFLRTVLARAEEKVEEGEREIERLRAQLEKLRRMLFGIGGDHSINKALYHFETGQEKGGIPMHQQQRKQPI